MSELTQHRGAHGNEHGLTIIELLIAATLGLIVAIGVFDFFDASNRSYTRESDVAAAQNSGRVALDVMAAELRAAGFSPFAAGFHAIAAGNANRVRRIADLDADGVVGTTAAEIDENVSYVFAGPDAKGLYELRRGVDLNGDWVFTGAGESVSVVATNVVPVDYDQSGAADPFLTYAPIGPPTVPGYNPTMPATNRVTVTFGVRSEHKERVSRRYSVSTFRTDVALRNR